MKIYETTIRYKLVHRGPMEALSTPAKVVEYMAGAFDEIPTQEAFYVVCLDRKNKPLGRHRVTLGTATAALAHAREIFRIAIMASATAVICVHNHPSGDPAPSSADCQFTRGIREAGRIVDIDVLDHVIIGLEEDDSLGLGYYSFREAGLISEHSFSATTPLSSLPPQLPAKRRIRKVA